MKTAKRVLAILMAMLMAVSAFAVAASAAESLQAQINAAAAGATVGITQNTRESVTVTKNLTIDLGGKILKSVKGYPAITVSNGATVTIQNGYLESYCKDYSSVSETMIREVAQTAPSTVVASGAGTTVILSDIRALGGLVRIPGSTAEFTAGSAVKIYNGAQAVLNGAVLVGSYGVSNDPANTGRADGTVTINEAILVGYLDYVKRLHPNGVVYDEATVEKVNAADRIAGFLNSNVKLETYEQDLIDKALDDRIYIFTKKPVDDQAIVTLDKNTGLAKITASEVKYLEREIGVPKNTDCSYKYVPINAYDVASGKTYALDTDLPVAELEGKEIRINYRLMFELKGDFKKVANNFDAYYNQYYGILFDKADELYDKFLVEYNKIVDTVVDLYKQVDEAGAETATYQGEPVIVDGQPANISNILGDDFYFILRTLISIGGVTMYNKATNTELTTNQFGVDDPLYNYGQADIPEYVAGEFHEGQSEFIPGTGWVETDGYYDIAQIGALDKVNVLVEQLKAIKGESSLRDQSKWVDYAHFVLDNYNDVIGLVGELRDTLSGIYTELTTNYGDALNQLKVTDKLSTLTSLINTLDKVDSAIGSALENSIVSDLKDKVDSHANDGTVETYVGKLASAASNYRQYFQPERFLAEDGKFFLAYAVSGPTEVVVIEKGKLHVTAFGGVVNFSSDSAGATPAVNEQWKPVPYAKSVTMTAVADAGNEFMYYMDGYTNRILSTNPVLTFDTQAERYVIAVFESASAAYVTLTNTSGVLYDTVPFNAEGTDVSSVDAPTFKGYEVTGWGPKGVTSLAAADFTSAYLKGNSAFENGAVYTIDGYAFKLNKSTSNKYLAMPKYKEAMTFTVSFIDNGETWSRETTIGHGVSYTAKGSNFSYWMNSKGQVVSVSKTYEVVPNAEDVELTAVYGAAVEPNGYVNITAAVDEDVRYRIYTERAIPVSSKVLSAGVIVCYDSSKQTPVVADINNTTVKAAYSTSRANDGVYSIGLTKTSIANYPNGIFVRAFVEIATATGSEYIYSNVYSSLAPTTVH